MINYNPVVITKGIPLFYDNRNVEVKLETKSVRDIGNGIIQIHYRVMRE